MLIIQIPNSVMNIRLILTASVNTQTARIIRILERSGGEGTGEKGQKLQAVLGTMLWVMTGSQVEKYVRETLRGGLDYAAYPNFKNAMRLFLF